MYIVITLLLFILTLYVMYVRSAAREPTIPPKTAKAWVVTEISHYGTFDLDTLLKNRGILTYYGKHPVTGINMAYASYMRTNNIYSLGVL